MTLSPAAMTWWVNLPADEWNRLVEAMYQQAQKLAEVRELLTAAYDAEGRCQLCGAYRGSGHCPTEFTCPVRLAEIVVEDH